jgi:hypothetical protein
VVSIPYADLAGVPGLYLGWSPTDLTLAGTQYSRARVSGVDGTCREKDRGVGRGGSSISLAQKMA